MLIFIIILNFFFLFRQDGRTLLALNQSRLSNSKNSLPSLYFYFEGNLKDIVKQGKFSSLFLHLLCVSRSWTWAMCCGKVLWQFHAVGERLERANDSGKQKCRGGCWNLIQGIVLSTRGNTLCRIRQSPPGCCKAIGCKSSPQKEHYKQNNWILNNAKPIIG